MKNSSCVFGIALFVASCHGGTSPFAEGGPPNLPYYDDPTFTPNWFSGPDDVPTDFHAIGGFSLVDQSGGPLSEEVFDGSIYIANFFFAACPGICPTTMANMARLQEAFRDMDDVLLLSHSVTPEADSGAVLEAYAQRMGVLASKWYLATGDRETIYGLGKKQYFADEDLGEPRSSADGNADFLHTESFFLVDRDRRIRGVYNGMNGAAVSQLIADVETLRHEARPVGT